MFASLLGRIPKPLRYGKTKKAITASFRITDSKSVFVGGQATRNSADQLTKYSPKADNDIGHIQAHDGRASD
ncbi:hypothetical protein [Muricauda sp. MAR_2010_75]|uniref:hypothetical protein n=1 Tax=Allomuricauda sp. MAR_2010_75 TaxID=1250232 RepID=UPI0005642F5C|nr:hypothetical protein [Muricauda sp. MAR_2010_75]